MRISRFAGALLAATAVGAIVLSRGPSPTVQAANSGDRHDPANAVANLDVHPGLQATLFASEPTITNPTNLDIDHRGRVWLCDVMNYRGNNGRRPAGDRILILEDTDGDGKSDTCKVFYQGRDVDSAMGICVLGNKVIVSCSPNILVFTFDENDKVVSKETLFTRTGQPQHDHSAHSFLFGPDGKLYWNFGNTGQAVHDKDGQPVVDEAGNTVADNGKPYFGGMVFRCDPDGSHFEVLAHNFRNNYEVTIDSFGTLWQSDNDDDGNRGVRINYVMEFGNFGYRDELTGAGWNTPRSNLEAEIPLRHWHLNDPGVVPNLLQTGQGSPAGICVNEGSLLPAVFRDQVIHCDPGPSVARSYPVQKRGAGYTAEVVNILDGSKKNNWFRPADVCIAPDGSLFVTDWYDPGVGGHGQRDVERGRIFRVAPPGSKYQVATCDFKSAAGGAEALKSPNLATRYLAWTALRGMGVDAEPVLLKLWQDTDPRVRARALWLLGKIDGKGAEYVGQAIKDNDPDIRVVGVRLARQLKLEPAMFVRPLVNDPAPEVRRDCSIALRHNKSAEAAALWTDLAVKHDGKDRWYLEALGIGADRQWDTFLSSWLARVGDAATRTLANRDIVWRSRASKTPDLLARIIRDPSVPTTELSRYFRAFDFQASGPAKEAALLNLVLAEPAGDAARQTLTLSETVKRLKNVDLSKQPQLAGALERLLERSTDKAGYVEIVGSFALARHYPDLLAIARLNPDQQVGVNAVKVLLDRNQKALLREAVDDKNPQQALATVQALATAADDRALPVLLPVVEDSKRDVAQRREAVRALARSRNGARTLLRLARSQKLSAELREAAGPALHLAPWNEVRSEAAKLFPAPVGKGDKPLPLIGELVKMRGDVGRGEKVFKGAGTCANCHIVNGDGKEVGPNLSEIGKKLSREAFFESILYPSAAISHNYETYIVETKNGTQETGLLVSDTPQAITLKAADGIQRVVKRDDIEQMRKSPVSLMPADLYKALTAQDLADVVEFLQTLKEARPNKK